MTTRIYRSHLAHKIHVLAAEFTVEARRLDIAYLARDPRAAEGGGRDEGAVLAEGFARRLRELAAEVDEECL